jgi:hypothetical protein
MKRVRTRSVFASLLRIVLFVMACVVIVSAWPCGAFHDVGLIEDDSDESMLAHLICALVFVWNLEELYPDDGSNPQNSLVCLSDIVSVPILFLLI